jgi:spermidine/putrescine transport system permease protein
MRTIESPQDLATDQQAPASGQPATARSLQAIQWLDREQQSGLKLIGLPFLVALVGLGFPIGLLLIYSFWTQDYLTIDRTLTLKNYIEIFTQPLYGDLLLRSVLMAGTATVATVILAYPIAYFIAFHGGRRKAFWMFLITVPFWTSYLLRVFAWKVILGFNGVINSSLISAGLITEPLEFLLYNPTAVVITLAHAYAPFAVLPILVSLQKIDPSLLEAATDLGDGPMRRFLRVTLPLSMPGLLSAAMIVFIPTVGDYVTPALVGGTSGYMIANTIQTQFLKANNWPLGAALAVTSMLAATLIALAFLALSRLAGGRPR